MTEPTRQPIPDATRPTIFGYLHVHRFMTDDEQAVLRLRMTQAARREGYTLGRVYVEQPAQSPAAFQSLVEALRRQEVKAVIVPSMTHLTALGTAASMKQQIEYETGARVLVADALSDRPRPQSGGAGVPASLVPLTPASVPPFQD